MPRRRAGRLVSKIPHRALGTLFHMQSMHRPLHLCVPDVEALGPQCRVVLRPTQHCWKPRKDKKKKLRRER